MSPNPQRAPRNPGGTFERFNSGACSDDPCYQSLADQLNEVLPQIINVIGGPPGGGKNCSYSRYYEVNTKNYAAWQLWATSDELVASTACDGLALSTYPAVPWLNHGQDYEPPRYLWGVRNLPSSTSGSLQAWGLGGQGTWRMSPVESYAALEDTRLKGAAQKGPFLASPDGNYLGVTRKQGGSTAHFMTIFIGPPFAAGYGGGPNLPVISGDISLPTNPTGPAEGLWLRKKPYVFLPTKLNTDLMYIIDVRQPQAPVIVKTIGSGDSTITNIRAVRTNREETVLYVAGADGVAAWNILDPANASEASAVTTPGRSWDSMHFAQGTTQETGWIFVAEKTSATNIATRTFDVSTSDPSSISLNTSKNLTGTFPNTAWGEIRPMRGPAVTWFNRQAVGALSIPASTTGSATFVVFNLDDRASVSVETSFALAGLDTNFSYALVNGGTANTDPIFLQRGLGVVVDTLIPVRSMSPICQLVGMDQIVFRTRTAGLEYGAGNFTRVPVLHVPANKRDIINTNFNADLLQGFEPDDFLHQVGTSTADGVPRWGTAYGDELQDTGVTIDDDDNLAVPGTTTSDSFIVPTSTITTGTTIDSTYSVVLCDATSAAFTVTLPTAASSAGQRFYIKKIDSSANAVTIDGNASETIDDVTTRILSMQYDAVEIVSDGSEWWVVAASVPDRATATTLGAGVTTFAVKSGVMTITGDGGANTIATITGGRAGQVIRLVFVDGNVTVTDDNSHAADSVDLSAAFTSADDTTLSLTYDGTSWYEVARSVN